MKLSQFKNNGVKKIRFENNIPTIIQEDMPVNGDISMYDMDYDRLLSIKNDIVDKYEDLTDEMMIYLIFPYVCDIEIDVEIDEFIEMINKPSKPFLVVLGMIMSVMEDIVEYGNGVSTINEKAEKVEEKVKVIIPIETKEEKLEKLYSELNNADMSRKKEIIREIQILEETEK